MRTETNTPRADYFETAAEPRPCVVCGTSTHDRHVTPARPPYRMRGYKTPRCRELDACAARRNAGRSRPR